MELTGKAKEKFKEFFTKDVNDDEYSNYILNQFYDMHLSMQYGVYVDFFESKGIMVGIIYNIGFKSYNIDVFTLYNGGWSTNIPKTRPEARTKAIEKANDLLNERL